MTAKVPSTCQDCNARPVKFAWRWIGLEDIGGYICFICCAFSGGGRPGAEVLGIRVPKDWYARTHWMPAVSPR